MVNHDGERSSIDEFLANESKEKPPERSIERLQSIPAKVLPLIDTLNHDGSPNERVVWYLLMAAVEAAHAGSDSEAFRATRLNIEKVLKELRTL